MIDYKGRLLISEIYPFTFQGEGKFIGEPSVFVRLAGCSLRCSFCDSIKVWDEKFKDKWRINPDDLYSLYNHTKPYHNLVITGGEPLLWQNNSVFLRFIKNAMKRHKRIVIETNGTIFPTIPQHLQPWYSCSPKLSNSGIGKKDRYNEHALTGIAVLNCSYFKFVCSTEEDVIEIAREYSFIPKSKIYIMPEGKNVEQINKSFIAIKDSVLAHEFMLTDRLHIRIGVQ